MKFFTADTHFNHANIMKYCNRPFRDINEMNDTLVKNWNEKVNQGDIVYHLGDFGWGQGRGYQIEGLAEIINSLNGQIFLIEGSHDKPANKLAHKFVKILPLMTIKEGSESITLCHYCMRTWRRSHFNTWHLFGHSHGRLEPIGKSWDVGVDNNNYEPLSFFEIRQIMQKRPDNFNRVNHE